VDFNNFEADMIKSMLPEHWDRVKEIYEAGIATGNATFQDSAPSWKEWNESHLPHSRLLSFENGKINGWAALTPVSDRCVYAGVAEVSIYVDTESRSKGIGRQLLLALLEDSEKHGIWTLQAGIFPENEASIRLHLSCGFRMVGRRERIGKMNGIWRDTIMLERRSPSIGIN
jgi:phosphinothricin acetyltransferase